MHTPADVAEDLLKHRFQIINLWRPVNHAALDRPLAFCDYRSIDWDSDFTPTTIHFATRVGENFSVTYNPQHKWKYLRGMGTDEIALIKWYFSLSFFEDDLHINRIRTVLIHVWTVKLLS